MYASLCAYDHCTLNVGFIYIYVCIDMYIFGLYIYFHPEKLDITYNFVWNYDLNQI